MKRYTITVNGQSYDVQVEEVGVTAASASSQVAAAPAAPAAPSPQAAPAPSAAPAAGGSVSIKAPMPGTLMSYKVAIGQVLRKGDVVLILEAMKMENEIVAPSDGTVVALRASEGASVNTGDVLVELT
jgi:biotin carboxyl carrier protein